MVHIYPVSWFIYIQYPGLHILHLGLCIQYPGLYNLNPGLYFQYPGLYIQYPGLYIRYPGLYILYPGLYILYSGLYILYSGLYIHYPGVYTHYPGLYNKYPGWYIYVVKKLNSLGNGKPDKIEPIGQENDITGDLETQDDLKRDEDDLADTQAAQQVNNALSEPSQLRPKPSTGSQGEDLGIYCTMLGSFYRYFPKWKHPNLAEALGPLSHPTRSARPPLP